MIRTVRQQAARATVVALVAVTAACGTGEGSAPRREQQAGGDVGSRAAGASATATAPASGVVLPHDGTTPHAAGRSSAAAAPGAGGSTTAADTSRPRTDSARWAPLWAKVKYPAVLPGAILPNKRIVAYYGNINSKKMGILGEIPPEQMMARLDAQAKEWERADPARPVVRMLELVAIVAQADTGKDGMYRRREAKHLIDRVHGWARARGWQFMVDIQNGHSNYLAELEYLRPWLQQPDVHLALDPEFDMVGKTPPGRKIGTTDAAEINQVIAALGDIVTRHKLPPKVLVVHRFTRNMLTNADRIRLDPRVQVVIDMDGWGAPFLKRATYRQYISPFPVQYTGFKIFYHNDTKKGDPLMRPSDVLKLYPRPLFIMYQ